MNKKLLTVLCSGFAIAVCAAVIVITALFLTGRTEGFSHLRGGADLTLTRESLQTRGLNGQGYMEETSDSDPEDFTRANEKNIFGVTGDTVMLPGCAFTAEMTVRSDPKTPKPFAYWLGIEVKGEPNELFKRLKLTVTVDGGEPKSAFLGDGLSIGSEREPLARITEGAESSFTVRVEFDRNVTDGGNAQNEWAVFDLVVYAVNL